MFKKLLLFILVLFLIIPSEAQINGIYFNQYPTGLFIIGYDSDKSFNVKYEFFQSQEPPWDDTTTGQWRIYGNQIFLTEDPTADCGPGIKSISYSQSYFDQGFWVSNTTYEFDLSNFLDSLNQDTLSRVLIDGGDELLNNGKSLKEVCIKIVARVENSNYYSVSPSAYLSIRESGYQKGDQINNNGSVFGSLPITSGFFLGILFIVFIKRRKSNEI